MTNQITRLKRAQKILSNESSHFLCLEVIGVIIASRQHIRTEHNASLDLAAKPVSPGGVIHLFQIIDLRSREVVRELPRNGIYQQLYWSPDGKWLCGTANMAGENWTVARIDASTGELNKVHSNQCCTPDWFPDSNRIIFSKRKKGQEANDGYGWTELWMADGDGGNPGLLYGEESHIYGGAVSPDSQYILFGRGPDDDGGGGEDQGGEMCIMRLGDAPIITGATPELRTVHPDTGDGPVVLIGIGWEPFWTHRELW